MTTSIDASQRGLIVGIVIATLLLLALTIVDLARGGRPDPPNLRAAATLLDGAWRFRTGDDPRWADINTDDSGWGTIDLTAPPGSHDGDVGLPDYVGGWMSHGHPDYTGYAWYRRGVTVPAGLALWDVLGPTIVEDAYEIYWNGRKLGGSGRLGPDPRVVGTRPLRFALPGDAAGTRGVLAIRAFKLPGGTSPDGGGMRSAPILAPRPTSDGLHRAQWERTIAGYIVEAIEPIAMFAVVALAFWGRSRSSHQGFLIFASIALALMAARRLNNAITSWTDLMDLRTWAWLASVMWLPTLAAWGMAWNRWCLPAWRSLDALAIVLALIGFIAAVLHWATVITVIRFGWLALFVVLAARIAVRGPLRIVALITLAAIVAAYFGGELLDPLGVPGIWFPYGIGVSRTQYIYVAIIPLVAFLMVRTLKTKQA